MSGLPMLYPLTPKAFLAQKFNPTRISTPGGTIGVGGSLLSIYPLEQPGGYMMLARTLDSFTERYQSYPFEKAYKLAFVDDLETDVADTASFSICSSRLLSGRRDKPLHEIAPNGETTTAG